MPQTFSVWANLAEKDIGDQTGVQLSRFGMRDRAPRAVWRTILPSVPAPVLAITAAASADRWLRKGLEDVREGIRLVAHRRWNPGDFRDDPMQEDFCSQQAEGGSWSSAAMNAPVHWEWLRTGSHRGKTAWTS